VKELSFLSGVGFAASLVEEPARWSLEPIAPLELVRFARKEPFVIASTDHLFHLCNEAIEARQQFFDERSGKPITS
jgi:hypothetical protein